MINKILLWLTGRMPARAIDLDDQYYIERYRVFGVGRLEVLIHRYLGCDGDREVHDHPHKWCLGIPLRGGYSEQRVIGFCPKDGWLSKYVEVRPWRWNLVGAMRFHRIASVKPGTWTLFIRWHRFKRWSFATSYPDAVAVILQERYAPSGDDWHKSAPTGKQLRQARGTQ